MLSATTTTKKPDEKKAHDVGVSFYPDMLKEIDSIRGDTSRSLWLRRAVIRELERQRKEREEEGKRQQQQDITGVWGSRSTNQESHQTTLPVPYSNTYNTPRSYELQGGCVV